MRCWRALYSAVLFCVMNRLSGATPAMRSAPTYQAGDNGLTFGADRNRASDHKMNQGCAV